MSGVLRGGGVRGGLCLVVCAVAAALLGGCVGEKQVAVGSSSDFDRDKSVVRNGGPVVLDIRDAAKSGTASGVGPARYTSIGPDSIETMQSGTVPRDLFVEIRPDGTVKTNLSSGTDIKAGSVKYDPVSKSFEVHDFATSTSEPLRAHAEAYDRLVAYWNSRDAASKEVLLKQLEVSGDVVKSVAPEFFALVRAAIGVP